MTAVSNGVLLYATDPDPTAGEIVFDFVAGQIALAVALEGATATNAAAAVATASGAANGATVTDATPAGLASGAGVAHDATVTTSGNTSVTAGAATTTGTAHDATVTTSAPPVAPVDTSASSFRMPTPRLSNAGRNVQLRLTADLGRLSAYAATRLEYADEELIELL